MAPLITGVSQKVDNYVFHPHGSSVVWYVVACLPPSLSRQIKLTVRLQQYHSVKGVPSKHYYYIKNTAFYQKYIYVSLKTKVNFWNHGNIYGYVTSEYFYTMAF